MGSQLDDARRRGTALFLLAVVDDIVHGLLDFVCDVAEDGRCRFSADVGRRRDNGFTEAETQLL